MRSRKNHAPLVVCILSLLASEAAAQGLLFDFDSTPAHTPLPVNQYAGDVTALFTGTGQSYSIQLAGSPGFTPVGFSGNCLYPNGVFPSDLLVTFSQAIQDASILYAPAEFGCDSSATMRITGYLNGVFVATSTATAPTPGTWPTGVLTLSSAQGFDHVVIHYDAPPACADWSPIFMADNMTVTPVPALSINDVAAVEGNAGTTTLGFTVTLSPASNQTVTVDYATADGTATTADGDYLAASGTLTFAPGVTTQPVNVTVNGDVKNEADETLAVDLSAPVHANILTGQGTGTITNDDPAMCLLTVSTAGLGTGSVTSSPPGIACGADCTESYAAGTAVSLNAEPGPSSTFEGWSGGSCSGTSLACPLTMDTARSATATFMPSAATGTAYFTLGPCRILDSRVTTGPWGGQPLGAQQERTATVVGGACGIPATAKAVSFNLTATAATADGHIRVYPAGTPRPATSSLNFAAARTRANNGIVKLGAAGDLTFFSGQTSGGVHVILDVSGYFE